MRSGFALVVLLLLVCACGGSSSDSGSLLVLRNYDTTAEDYRAAIRKLFLSPSSIDFCHGLTGLSPEEVVQALGEGTTAEPDWTPPAGGILHRGQTPNPDDLLEAAGIIQEECGRILS